MNYSLIMAIFWLVLGVGWFIAAWTTGGKLPVMRLGSLEFSPAWAALLLCLYNLARWQMRRRRKPPMSLHEALEARRRMHRDEERPPGPPDPNFIFTDQPAASESQEIQPAPPPNEPPPAS